MMLSLILANKAVAQDAIEAAPDVMVVLDASGSMWGRVDGEPKIGIVRDSVGSLLDALDRSQSRIGLIAYGHRRKGDCSDIEMLSEPKADNSDAIETMVRSLNPKGKTPLGASVRMAAETLKYTENKATVLLLSDGIETCDVDPCALGQELEALGVDFTAHVIGFDLKDEDAEQLVCLAENTGGRYLSADNAEELGEAMRNAGSAAASPDVEPVQDWGVTRIRAVLDDTGEMAGAMRWTLVGPDGERTFETPLSDIDMNVFRDADVAPGDYTLRGQDGEFEGELALLLPLGEDAEIRLVRVVPETLLETDGPATAFSPFTVRWKGTNGKDDAIAVVPKGASAAGENILARGNLDESGTATLTAPDVGEYDLIYVFDSFGLKRVDARVPITVEPVTFSLEPVGDIWAGEAFLVNWSGPGGSSDSIAIGPRTSGSSDYNSIDDVSDGNPLRLKAPSEPGEYELRYYGRNYKLLFTQPVIVE